MPLLFPNRNGDVLLVQPSCNAKGQKRTKKGPKRTDRDRIGYATEAQAGTPAKERPKQARKTNEKEKWITGAPTGRYARKSKI